MFVSKRKYGRLPLLLGSVITYFLIPTAIGQIFHLPSQMPVGNSDMNGFARLDREFYEMPLGNDQSTRLFFRFSTDPRQEPKYMGAYWSIPFFDSQISKTANNKYHWITPNLQTYIFNKTPKPDKGYKETYILSSNGSWKLHLTRNNDVLIEGTEDSANRYTFKKGKLASFRNGTNADLFKISYGNRGVPISVYNANKNTTEMEFTYGKEGLLVKIGFPKNKKALLIAYDTCDTFAEDGTKQGKILKSVSSIAFEDGETEEYKYSAETRQKGREILTYKEDENAYTKIPINKFERKIGKDNKGFIEWDATTGIIASDSGGTYAIRNPMFDKHNPEYGEAYFTSIRKRETRSIEAKISYKKPENKYAESWEYNINKAIEITQNPDTGEQTRTSYIAAPGKASMKIRKIEKKLPDGKNWQVRQTNAYDYKGNKIREIDESGNFKEYIYDKKGTLWKILKNGELCYMAYNPNPEDSLRAMEENPDGSITKIVGKEDGIFEIQTVSEDKIKSKIIYNKNENSMNICGVKIFINE